MNSIFILLHYCNKPIVVNVNDISAIIDDNKEFFTKIYMISSLDIVKADETPIQIFELIRQANGQK